jgi:regulator of protease activity HflC (stomatin/prohibitin superfamily)
MIRYTLFAGLLLGMTVSGCNCVEVEGNEVAVIETLNGPDEQVRSSGLHYLFGIRNDDFKYPINDQTFVMGKAKQAKQANTSRDYGRNIDEEELLVKSKDGQKVWISLTLRYALDRNRIIHKCSKFDETRKGSSDLCGIHVEARNTYETTWIRPEVVRAVKDLANKYTAKQIYAEMRPELNNKIEDALKDNIDLGGKGIMIKTFVLDLVRLEENYEAEITATVLQDQRRIRAEKEAIASKQEAIAAREKAQANVEVVTQTAEAAKQKMMKEAEADRYAVQQKAESDRFTAEQAAIGLLAQGAAEAKVAKLKKNADYDGVAGERRMKVELAKYQSEAAKGLFPNAVSVGDPTVTQILKVFGGGIAGK